MNEKGISVEQPKENKGKKKKFDGYKTYKLNAQVMRIYCEC